MTEPDLNEEATGGDEAEASQTTESPFAQDEVPQSAHLLMQGGIQLMALISAVILWGAADTWALSSDLALAGFFALIASIAFGIVGNEYDFRISPSPRSTTVGPEAKI